MYDVFIQGLLKVIIGNQCPSIRQYLPIELIFHAAATDAARRMKTMQYLTTAADDKNI